MFVFQSILMLLMILAVVWVTVGDELFSMISSSVDYLMHPLERKLRHARKNSCE